MTEEQIKQRLQIKKILVDNIEFHSDDTKSEQLDQAAAEIMKLMQGWVNVENIPNERDEYEDHFSIEYIVTDGKRVTDGYYDYRDDTWIAPLVPTHYMPYPTPPLTPKSTDQ